ncbi:hypothetical protein HNQ80_002330 [Anaerosolibacter carboniphilus]|uniref:DUF3298 domain-containing protein n=1 Tax=Anaerosolibacter carboniphilus TaxID=1417629 RepID=A0A841KS67_9FIRM|nr:DUF3298 and DUF4163 domain-containing protein [Anaerosolibacter carboniphilus]MBB6216231.1 hypothetical protein [Anaerosolibacter carboniphilus]
MAETNSDLYRSDIPENPVTFKTKTIKSDTTAITLDLKIPVAQGLSNPQIQSNINKQVEDDILEFKKGMEEAAKDNAAEAKKKGKAVIPYIASNIYSVTYNKASILSINILYYERIQGKHSYIKVPYNYSLLTGKSLSIEDLFREGSNYKEVINQQIKQQLQANRDKYFAGTPEQFKGIAEDQPFYLENGHVVIFFGFHQIAPTESQLPVFKIPFSSLSSILKPIFLRG